MLTQEDFYINKYAQEKIELTKFLIWFDSKNEVDQKMIIRHVGEYIKQAIPDKVNWNQNEINCIIPSVPLKQSFTPIILLKTKPLKIALEKIYNLPKEENKKSMIALISIFKHMDQIRRNTECKDGCNHEWHNIN